MVAPTRTPQARGVKCDLCKQILSQATWLDQTKLAKKAEDAKLVLALIVDHTKTDCPCIPKNIETLLVGSTHFEIHRLFMKDLDAQVHRIQCELFQGVKQVSRIETAINDCYDTKRGSRFKNYKGCFEAKQCERAKLQLQHLQASIDSWTMAIEDQANPFNSKLALRLGLTHHIVYACYLFKFYKILDYQLKASVLLLNVFKSIDGVTTNAILHANYLLIRSLMDCAQFQLARQYLKQAIKIDFYQDKTYYESILLSCVECELRLLDNLESDKSSILDDLTELISFKKDDKLQHYYARTLAMSTIIRYIQYYRSKSENCFEFFHTFRFVCAIIRRCYETSFALVLYEKGTTGRQSQANSPATSNDQLKQNQILDHNWIRFAVCDFSFTTFEVLSEFYIRAGMPECLELLFNGLSLVAYRSGSIYWQSKMLCISVELDLMCDKLNDAETKLETMSRTVSFTNDPLTMNLIRLHSEISFLSLMRRQKESVIKKDVMLDLLERMKVCRQMQIDKINHVKIFDCKSNSMNELHPIQSSCISDSLLVTDNLLFFKLGLTLLRKGIPSLLDVDIASPDAKYLVSKISDQFNLDNIRILDFHTSQLLLEIIVHFTSIDNSEQILLDTVSSSSLFMRNDDELGSLHSQLSSLTLNIDLEKTSTKSKRTKDASIKTGTTKLSRIPLSRSSKRKGTYEVAKKSEENLLAYEESTLICDPIELLRKFSILSREEIILSYLKYSEANPNYLIYRQAHELMLCLRLNNYLPQHNDRILFHFTESINSNTMRYRWMMYEEQQASPFDPTSSKLTTSSVNGGDSNCSRGKFLNFYNSLTNVDKLMKSMTRLIPDDFRLCQFKYIWDRRLELEHLIVMCFDNTSELVCIHSKRCPTSDDFFEDAKNSNSEMLAIPNRLESKIEESRRSLFTSNCRAKSELRQNIELDLGIILHDLENEWLGPFRFILCAKINDYNYNKMITELVDDINSILSQYQCRGNSEPPLVLRMLLEGASLLTRDEFCSMISKIYGCQSNSVESRKCFNKWLKAIEKFTEDHDPNISKTALLKKLARGQIGLILDQRLENIPFESLPAVRIIGQGMFRVPSLRFYSWFASRRCMPIKVDPNSVAYVLDPASNLAKTRERFEQKFKANNRWLGIIGQAPRAEQLELWLAREQLYIFIGHGAGTTYYNKLCKGRGLSAMEHIESAAIVMGCSSGRMVAEGPLLEPFSVGWAFIFRGAPCYVGLLWDVTDTDIDKFTDCLLCRWMSIPMDSNVSLGSSNRDLSHGENQSQIAPCITDASIQARLVCHLKFLVGSAPVVYGLPISCRGNVDLI